MMLTPTRTAPRTAAVVASLTLLVLLLAALAAGPASAARPYVLTKGHVDAFSPVIEDGRLALRLADDTRSYGDEGHVIRDVDEVLLNLHDGAKETLPALPPDYAFLGQEGDSQWAVDFSGSNQSTVLWPGWDTNHPSVADVDALAPNQFFRMRLVDVAGPSGAGVHVYAPDGFGPPRIFASTTTGAWNGAQWPGVPGPNAWSLFHQHQHAAWSFSKPGLHQLTFAVDAQKDGKPITASADYRFFVGDLPAGGTAAAPDAGLTDLALAGLQDRYREGDPVSLSVSQQPATDEDHYHWFTRCGTGEKWKVVSGALAATHAFAASAALDGCRIQARLYDHDHALLAVSTPATLHVASAAPTLTVEGLKEHYHPGDVATLTAKQSPDSGEDHWHWFVRCGENPWTVVNGQATSTLSLPLEIRHDGCLVRTKLYDHDHAVIAESEPVVLHVRDHHAVVPPPVEPPVGSVPLPGPAPTPAPTPAPAPKPAVSGPRITAFRVAGSGTARVATVRRQRGLRATVALTTGGRLRVLGTITATQARKIGLRVPRGARSVRFGRGSIAARAGGSTTVRIALTAAQRRALARVRGMLRVRLTATVRAANGRTHQKHAAVRLRR